MDNQLEINQNILSTDASTAQSSTKRGQENDSQSSTPAEIVSPLERSTIPVDRLWERIVLYFVLTGSAVGLLFFIVKFFYYPFNGTYQEIVGLYNLSPEKPNIICLAHILLAQQKFHMSLSLRIIADAIGVIMILVGGMFVLKGIETSYNLNLRQGEYTSSLQTSSPGLVLITLGTSLLVVALLKTQQQEFEIDQRCLSTAALSTRHPTSLSSSGNLPPHFDGGAPLNGSAEKPSPIVPQLSGTNGNHAQKERSIPPSSSKPPLPSEINKGTKQIAPATSQSVPPSGNLETGSRNRTNMIVDVPSNTITDPIIRSLIPQDQGTSRPSVLPPPRPEPT